MCVARACVGAYVRVRVVTKRDSDSESERAIERGNLYIYIKKNIFLAPFYFRLPYALRVYTRLK